MSHLEAMDVMDFQPFRHYYTWEKLGHKRQNTRNLKKNPKGNPEA